MKNLISILALSLIIIGCSTTSKTIQKAENNISKVSDTVRVANDELEYEVIIIEPGFSTWLASQAKPRGFYSENYLEGRNKIYYNQLKFKMLLTKKSSQIRDDFS